jgi:hypothetical protein
MLLSAHIHWAISFIIDLTQTNHRYKSEFDGTIQLQHMDEHDKPESGSNTENRYYYKTQGHSHFHISPTLTWRYSIQLSLCSCRRCTEVRDVFVTIKWLRRIIWPCGPRWFPVSQCFDTGPPEIRYPSTRCMWQLVEAGSLFVSRSWSWDWASRALHERHEPGQRPILYWIFRSLPGFICINFPSFFAITAMTYHPYSRPRLNCLKIW